MDKPSLSAILKDQGLFAKKSLGQHFLLDINLTSKIARLANITAQDIIFEIGPGPGGLTAALLQSPAKRLIAIEKDRRFAEHLRDYFKEYGERFEVIEADALSIDLAILQKERNLSEQNPKIIANLPYNVGTQLFINWINSEEIRKWPMTLMFQLEVAKRICAKTGDKEYGRLAIISDALCNARIAMPISRLAFTPPPKVESAVVSIEPKENCFSEMGILEKLTAAAFGQRRKMLRSSLSKFDGISELLIEAGIEETLRAENVPPEGFYRLALALKARQT